MKKLFYVLAMMLFCLPVVAQTGDTDPGKRPAISLQLTDAPVRTTIETIFKQANVKNYVIENDVAGFVTMTLENQTLENTLKLVLGSKLTYSKENDVYIVKTRKPSFRVERQIQEEIKDEVPQGKVFEVISLKHLDPRDLEGILGQLFYVQSYSRFRNNQNGNMGLGIGFGRSNSGQNNNGGFLR